MTKSQIINRARGLALLEKLHDLDKQVDPENPFASDIEDMNMEYDLAMDELIRSRPWLYAHDILMGSTISPLTEVVDADGDGVTTNAEVKAKQIELGYKYRYTLPSFVLDVVAINRDENSRFRNIIPETREALRAGISYFPELDGYPSRDDKGFVFVKGSNDGGTFGVLHSDTEVKSVFVKKEIDIRRAPGSFQNYFCHVLAVPLARIYGESAAKARELENLLPDLAMKAIRDEKSVARTNSHYQTILNWIDTSLSHLATVGHWGGNRGNKR